VSIIVGRAFFKGRVTGNTRVVKVIIRRLAVIAVIRSRPMTNITRTVTGNTGRASIISRRAAFIALRGGRPIAELAVSVARKTRTGARIVILARSTGEFVRNRDNNGVYKDLCAAGSGIFDGGIGRTVSELGDCRVVVHFYGAEIGIKRVGNVSMAGTYISTVGFVCHAVNQRAICNIRCKAITHSFIMNISLDMAIWGRNDSHHSIAAIAFCCVCDCRNCCARTTLGLRNRTRTSCPIIASCCSHICQDFVCLWWRRNRWKRYQRTAGTIRHSLLNTGGTICREIFIASSALTC